MFKQQDLILTACRVFMILTILAQIKKHLAEHWSLSSDFDLEMTLDNVSVFALCLFESIPQ